jgi:peptidoglycan/xylan/chitin deacetylase (PgdA/CDA1 family)
MARVHLTFDNGPHPEGTPLILDTLARHQLTATFFVLGKHISTHDGRALSMRCIRAGHRIGHHSWSHEIPLGEDARPDAVQRELQDTHDVLAGLWVGPRWFRPFGGGGHLGPHLLSPRAVQWLAARHYSVVLWNSVPGDWLDAEGWVDKALDDAERLDDMVVVLHDIVPDAMRHLDRFITTLKARGHTFATDWPPSVLPMVDGVPTTLLPPMVQTPENSAL